MPKVNFVEISKEELQKLFDETGRSRSQIAADCGLESESAIYYWYRTGKVPRKHYETLLGLKKSTDYQKTKTEDLLLELLSRGFEVTIKGSNIKKNEN